MEKRNLDDLTKMNDDQIRNELRCCKEDIYALERRLYKDRDFSDFDMLKSLQIEYCYIKRESEVRRSRSQAHREFMQRMTQKSKNRTF